MILLWFQQALKAAINEHGLLSEILNDVYTFLPLDKAPPYLYITLPGTESGSNEENIAYCDVMVHLMVRETGVVQTSHITFAIMKILELPLAINIDGQDLKFIFKPQLQTVTVMSDTITRRFDYHGRLKMNRTYA